MVAKAFRAIGSAEFGDLRPGLDLSQTNAQGNLALFDGPIPLTNFGLGTRRLAGAAVQQVAHDNAAILLVDEIEYGLEPHRLMRLLHHVRKKDAFSQVFVTTHSPTALQYLEPADLMTVRSSDAVTPKCGPYDAGTVKTDHQEALHTRSSRAESWCARARPSTACCSN